MKFRKEFKIGLIFIAATAILIWGIMYLKGLELFRYRQLIYAVYDRVNGLVPSNPVSIKGMKVGQVKTLYFSKKDPSKVIVEMLLNIEYPIPKNSVASIFSSDLMGSKEVEIIIGNSKDLIRNGDTLFARTESTLGEEVNQQLAPLKRKAENLISSIDSIATTLTQVLNESTRDNLVMAIEHVQEALKNIAHASSNLDTLVSTQRNHLANIIINVESISSNLRQNNDKIRNILTNLSELTDSLAQAKVPYTLNQVINTVHTLNQVLDKINKGEGSLGLLINDKDLYNELTKTASDLNALLEDIKTNPKKYLKVSVF